MPYADFCRRVRMICITLSHAFVTYDRSPRGKFDRLPCIAAESTFCALVEMGFAKPSPLARRSRLISGFCSSARIFAPRFLQTPLTTTPLAFR